MADDLAATLAEIRRRYSNTNYGVTTDSPRPLSVAIASAADIPVLLAAVEAALKAADELEHIKTGPPSGKEDEAAALGLSWCAARVREAISAALTGTETTDGE
jgi:hypothetical protein